MTEALGIPNYFEELSGWLLPIFLLGVATCFYELFTAVNFGVLKWRGHTYRQDTMPVFFWMMVICSLFGLIVSILVIVWATISLVGG